MIINIGKCIDCDKKLKDDRNTVYEEIIVDGRLKETAKVIGYICSKCKKKRFSAFLTSLIRGSHKRMIQRELEERKRKSRKKKLKLL